jgi:probable rRNA maturation factor
MKRAYEVSIEFAVDSHGAEVGRLRDLAIRVMQGEGVETGTELTVIITDDDEMQRMNRAFLGIDEPTDVLAFPDEADDFVVGIALNPALGDIAIGMQTAIRQAAEHSHSLDAELAHLLVHGILHLRGYDHVNRADEERRMRAREEYYLGGLDAVHQQ